MSSKRKKHLILSIFMLLPLLAGGLLWGYLHYQSGAFQRAYEHGNTYEQLNSLMNTTRYAEAVRQAGYDVDNYGLKMNNRIDSLTTKTKPAVVISVPTKSGVFARMDINADEDLMLEFDERMKLKTIVYGKGGENLHNNEIPKDDRDKYEAFVREAMEKTIEDIHDSMSR
ncbi:hypothetical protein AB3329_11530 [Streptococcus sp. H31]|uniref:hypothetical protein n=1 Tax=Streptococcus huangxiaojuni TaxID=3237239 RepID=UPI0034A55422